MKLIFCPACNDMVKLLHETRQCRCGESWGRYIDDQRAQIGGKAVAVGICNHRFLAALKGRPLRGANVSLDAWVFPMQHKRIKRVRAAK